MLEELGIVGISWRQDGSEALARFALPGKGRDERLRGFARKAGLAELAYLDTCNRVEIVFARAADGAAGDTLQTDLRPLAYELLAGRAPTPGEAERTLKAWHGEGACEHLFLVAAGLDSAAVGEVEIVGQVRACRDLAAELGLSGPRLELLFDEALSIAARVRGATRLGRGRVSLAEVAVARLRERLERTPGAVALVGVSAMTERTARSLAKAETPLIFVNRTLAKARAAALPWSAAAMPLADFLCDPPGRGGRAQFGGRPRAAPDRARAGTDCGEDALRSGACLRRHGRAGKHRQQRLPQARPAAHRHGRDRPRGAGQPGGPPSGGRPSPRAGGQGAAAAPGSPLQIRSTARCSERCRTATGTPPGKGCGGC